MATTPESCFTNEQLRLLLEDGLSVEQHALVREHLDVCDDCRKRLETMAGGTGWLPPNEGASAGGPAVKSPKLTEAIEQLHSETREIVAANCRLSDTVHGFLSPASTTGILGRLGEYEILEEISRGGMGIVFRARDPALSRIVAIKVLAPELAAQPNARSRFLREARAAAAITHEHVITIHAVEENRSGDAPPYLVMQYVAGKTLEQRIQDKPLTLVEILRISFEIALGLEAAHRHGLIHRDIKPGNILLENSVERVKITDFGLARAAEDTGLTQTGHVAGTPEYMAPEQVRGGLIDQRADLFGLGCVLYKMCTGISAFRAPTLMSVLHKVCSQEPGPVRILNPDVPEPLSQLIESLLAKDPARRPQSAKEVAAELGRQLAEAHGPAGALTKAAVARRPNRNFQFSIFNSQFSIPARLAWPAGMLIMVAAAAVWAMWPKSGPKPQSVAPARSSVPPAVVPVTSPFVVSGGDAERGFATLRDAVQAAQPGAVIECRFNEEQDLTPVSLTTPLILRAAPGFRPAFRMVYNTAPLLRTRTPLVIEGFKFRGVPRAPADANVSSAAVIEANGAPLLLANCEFAIPANQNPQNRQEQRAAFNAGCVRLVDAYGHFENCEFYSASASAIIAERVSSDQINRVPPQVFVRNCVHRGAVLVAMTRAAQRDVSIELARNILTSRNALSVDPGPEPLNVIAMRNIFDVGRLVMARPGRSRIQGESPQELVKWDSRRNLFSLRPGPEGPSDARTLTEGLAGLTNDSLVVEVKIFERIGNLGVEGPRHDARDFLLSRDEQDEVERLAPGLKSSLGIELEVAGPGEGYEAWRKKPQYREWQKLVAQHLRAP